MSRLRRRGFFQALVGLAAGSALGGVLRGGTGRLPGEADTSVLVLGTAQDGGLPHIGCYCPNCLRARKNPAEARAIASLALLDHREKKTFLIDCTPDIRPQYDRVHSRMKTGCSRRCVPEGIVLSHAHIGHYTGLVFYGYEALSADRLAVYASGRMAAFLEGNGPWNQLVEKGNIAIRLITADQSLKLTERLSLVPLPVPHRDEYSDTFGFMVAGGDKKLLYIPDIRGWDHWDRDIAEVCGNADIALLDGTFYSPDELPGRDLTKIGHPFITRSMERLQKAVKKTRICFTHLNHSNPALDREGPAFAEIHRRGFDLAEEGMEFII